ncbi:hypothetical protein [Clostridium sp. BNL1100]|nr:hypothetical protein [Clostridium sp. BNL1100]
MNIMLFADIQKSINDTNAANKKYSGTTPKFFRAPNRNKQYNVKCH